MTRPASSGRRRSPTRTAADVSSQDVSIPRTTSATPCLPLEGHGVGYGARREAGGPAHGEPGVAAGPGLPDEVRHHAHTVPGEREIGRASCRERVSTWGDEEA